MPTNQATSLSFYSYLFYLSKYYEVIDSLILTLKGKQIGVLQRYHHTGALIAMWIAVRFRSQPVWVFCVFNSFVHTLMYAYYFCSAVKIPFPRALKRNLTTLQVSAHLTITSGATLFWHSPSLLFLPITDRPDRFWWVWKASLALLWFDLWLLVFLLLSLLPRDNPHESLFLNILRSNFSPQVRCLNSNVGLKTMDLLDFLLFIFFFAFILFSKLRIRSSFRCLRSRTIVIGRSTNLPTDYWG